MPITIKGYETVKATAAATEAASSRSQFIKGLDAQAAKIDAERKANERLWFHPVGDGFQTDIRYGTYSLLEEGQRIPAKDSVALKELYESVKEQAEAGHFDEELEVMREKIKSRKPRAKKAT